MLNPSILEVDGVIIEFNNRMVLQDVYLKVEVGEIVALSGRNGTGKTTLLNYISGIGKMSTGSIRINHQRIESKYRYKHIQLLPQFHFIPSGLTVKQVLKDHHLKIDTLIHVFPLFKDKATQRIKTLSGGEQRLLEVFIVLYSKSDFCILDEPFNFLSPIHIEAIKTCIKQQALIKGILITDHKQEHVMDVADRHYTILNGNLVLGNNR